MIINRILLGRKRAVNFKALLLSFFALFFVNTSIFASSAPCSETKTTCIEKGGTRYYEGVPLTLDCWHYQTTESCATDSDNNCKALRDLGCTQTDAKCRTEIHGVCAVQDETYSCPTQKCDSFGIVCNDGKTYCLDGNCSAHEKMPDKDMGQSLAALSALGDASKQFDSKSFTIFTGEAEKCSKDNLGFSDCCIDEGWGEDLHLANCSDEEKKLAHDKALKITAYVGEYTVDHIIWTEHKKTYCIFNSKLARIVQVAGRRQLRLSFGFPEKPNCRGFTPEELQRIDFSKINFSEVVDEIKIKGMIDGETQSAITEKIARKTKEMSTDVR